MFRHDGSGVGRSAPDPSERGSVTAELALGMVGLVIVLAGALNVVEIGLVKLSTSDAATAAARAMARGEDPDEARSRARRLAGPGSEVQVDSSGQFATATVVRRVGLALPGGGGVDVTSTATSWTESPDDP